MTKIEVGKTYKFLIEYKENDLLTVEAVPREIKYDDFVVKSIYICTRDSFRLPIALPRDGIYCLKATVEEIQFLKQTCSVILDITDYSIIN